MIRVIIVADDAAAGTELAALLAAEADIVLAGQYRVDESRDADLTGVDASIWDLGENRTAFASQLEAIGGLGVPVLALGPHDAAGEVLAGGAAGFLSRPGRADRLGPAVRAVAADLLVFDPGLHPSIGAARNHDSGEMVEELTPRELDVLQLLAEGLSNKEIAERLGITDHTVKFHVNTILSKLDAHTRTEAVTRAARLGLIVL